MTKVTIELTEDQARGLTELLQVEIAYLTKKIDGGYASYRADRAFLRRILTLLAKAKTSATIER